MNKERAMTTHRIIRTLALLAALLGLATTAFAAIPEPDVVFYGPVRDRADNGNLIVRTNGEITLRLGDGSEPIASYTLGSDPTAGGNYVLKVAMQHIDARNQRQQGTALEGETASFYIDGVLAGRAAIPPKGSVISLPLDTSFGMDNDGDGLPDNFPKTILGNGSGDANGNGISDLEEFLNDDDPAACIWAEGGENAAQTCVFHPEVLRNCLSEAGKDSRHNRINLVQGTYSGAFAYQSSWGEDFDLTLAGGYATWQAEAGQPVCGTRNFAPGQTVLDGAGKDQVLRLDTASAQTRGKVRVEHLAVQKGFAEQASGGGIAARAEAGAVELIGTSVSGCSALNGGGLAIFSNTGSVLLSDNLIYANNAANGGGVDIEAKSGPITLLNNTLAENMASASGGGVSIYIDQSTAQLDITGNILFGNGAGTGAEVYINTVTLDYPPVFSRNNLGSRWGVVATGIDFTPDFGDNLTGDPGFVNPAEGDFRLAEGSACIDAGNSNHALLAALDMEGEGRIFGEAVDIGADEMTPESMAQNRAPIIVEGDSLTLYIDEHDASNPLSLALNAIDPDGDPLQWSLALMPTGGLAQFTGKGPLKLVSYTPAANFNGSDTFAVRVSDGSLTDTLTVAVRNRGATDGPQILTNLPLVLKRGASAAITGELLAATTGGQGAESLRFTLSAPPESGRLMRNGSALGLGESFTQSDIEGGAISYAHDGNTAFIDSLVLGLEDPGGNSTQSVTFAIIIDQPPALTLSTLPEGRYAAGDTLNISGTINDDRGIKSLSIEGIEVPLGENGSFSYALPLAEGANIITIAVTDIAGNELAETKTVYRDSTAPQLTVTTPADNASTGAALLEVRGHAEVGASVEVSVNGDSAQLATREGSAFSAPVYLEPGLNTLVVTAFEAQKSSSSIKRTLRYEPQAPAVSITDPEEDLTTRADSLLLKGTVSNPVGQVSVSLSVDGTDFTPPVNSGGFEQMIALDQAKTYGVVVTVTDEAGNQSVARRNIIADKTAVGDLDADGQVDVADALLALQKAVGLSPCTKDDLLHADVAPIVDGVSQPDGKLNVADALLILKKVVGLADF